MKTEFAWLIELAASSPSTPQYWAGSSLFCGDLDMAIRFARKVDAERAAMMMLNGMNVRICEHGWDVPSAINCGRRCVKHSGNGRCMRRQSQNATWPRKPRPRQNYTAPIWRSRNDNGGQSDAEAAKQAARD